PVEYIFVNVLDDGHGCDFREYSRFESMKRFGIISSYHKLVAHLREQGFDSFSGFSEQAELWFVFLLISSFWCIETDIRSFKKVKLNFRRKVALIAQQRAV